MTDEQRKALELVFDLTAHPGWKIILEECTEKVTSFKDTLILPRSIPEYELGFIHGKASAYNELLNMRNAMDQALKVDEYNANVETDDV